MGKEQIDGWVILCMARCVLGALFYKAHLSCCFILIRGVILYKNGDVESFITCGAIALDSLSSNFSLSTLLLFRLFPFTGSACLFFSSDLIVPLPLKGDDPGYHLHEWPCVCPWDYFRATSQSIYFSRPTSQFLCISVPFLEDKIAEALRWILDEQSLSNR